LFSSFSTLVVVVMLTNLAMKLWGTPLSPTSKTRPQDTETAEVLEEQPLPDAEEMGRNHWGYPAW
jgi:hypothetical protein